MARARRFAQIDPIKGPTAHIITGSIPEFGTNAFDVYLDDTKLANAVPVTMPFPALRPSIQPDETTSRDGTIKRRKFTVPDFSSDFINDPDLLSYTPPSPTRNTERLVQFDYGSCVPVES